MEIIVLKINSIFQIAITINYYKNIDDINKYISICLF